MNKTRMKWHHFFGGIFWLVFLTNISFFGLASFFNFHNFSVPFLYPETNRSSNVVIVTIDDESLQEYGKWPWKRSFQQEVIQKILDKNPKKVGLDILYSQFDLNQESDRALVETLKNSKIVSATQLNTNNSGVLYENNLGLQTGFIELNIDSNSFVRQAITTSGSNNSLAKQMSGRENIPQSFLINPRVNRPSVISVKSLLQDDSLSKIIENKYVILGTSALSLNDFHNIPGLGHIPGSDIHGIVLQQILEEQYWQEILSNNLFFIPIAFGMGVISQYGVFRLGVKNFKKFVWIGNILLVVIFLIFLLNLIILDLNVIGPLIFTNSILPVSLWVWSLSDERENIKKALSLYISSKVMHQILENPKQINLGGQKYDISIMFTDIRGFTSLSEKTDNVHEVANLLNQILALQTDVVLKNDGVIDKYIGDAVMAFWGAPIASQDHAYKSLLTACQIQSKIQDFNLKHDKKMEVGVGIHSGISLVGNFGSNKRVEYTAIGDPVNTASRIESITKLYEAKILISDSILSKLTTEQKEEFWIEELDKIKLKGKNKCIRVYEVLGLSNLKESKPKLVADLKAFNLCLELYYAGQFEAALKISKTINLKRAKIIANRCQELLSHSNTMPWEGIWTLEHK